jgi:hypothetical protein
VLETIRSEYDQALSLQRGYFILLPSVGSRKKRRRKKKKKTLFHLFLPLFLVLPPSFITTKGGDLDSSDGCSLPTIPSALLFQS